MIDLKEITTAVAQLARETGKFISNEAKGFSLSKVEYKGKSDLVSYVDKETEKKLVAGLREILPGAGFITEENTTERTKREYTWIVDPLDGTTNFVHGVPAYAISIGLAKENEILSGVVYEVTREECFTAWKGGGAYLDEEKISVTSASEIDDSLFSTGFPVYNMDKESEYLNILKELMKNAHGLRRLGSAATDLAYVACGRYEGFFEFNLKPWDVAAGIVLIKEAGGIVTDGKGGNDCLFGGEIVAAGPVHPRFIEVIQKHWL